MLGGFLALLSAITFGLNNASVRRGVLSGSVLQALAITVPVGVPFFLVMILVTGNIGAVTGLTTETFLWLSAAGVLHFVIGRYCNYRSTKAIGGNLSGPWKQSNLILALVLAIVFLGEVLTPLKVTGIVLILLGAYFTSKATFKKPKPAKEGAPKPEHPGFEPSYREGYSFALLSAVAYGSSPILVRMGLESQGPGSSFWGGLISYSSAALVIGLILLLPGRWQHVREVGQSSVRWFSLAAILVGFSQMFRYMALAIAPVSVVTPIQSTSVVFRVIFGWLINRNTEVFGTWVILGVIVTMLGVLGLSVSTEIVTANFQLPGVVMLLVEFRWP
ncbi:EamA family transporter [Saccharospirillum sp.]|uniref:EamA family transporter n=1 Tax=Saccharospirillum sp. TaxID=2033801 RepID=UPI00349FF379